MLKFARVPAAFAAAALMLGTGAIAQTTVTKTTHTDVTPMGGTVKATTKTRTNAMGETVAEKTTIKAKGPMGHTRYARHCKTWWHHGRKMRSCHTTRHHG